MEIGSRRAGVDDNDAKQELRKWKEDNAEESENEASRRWNIGEEKRSRKEEGAALFPLSNQNSIRYYFEERRQHV